MAVDPLVTRFERGGLQLENVATEEHEVMLGTILGPPADGLYLEIGMAGKTPMR